MGLPVVGLVKCEDDTLPEDARKRTSKFPHPQQPCGTYTGLIGSDTTSLPMRVPVLGGCGGGECAYTGGDFGGELLVRSRDV